MTYLCEALIPHFEASMIWMESFCCPSPMQTGKQRNRLFPTFPTNVSFPQTALSRLSTSSRLGPSIEPTARSALPAAARCMRRHGRSTARRYSTTSTGGCFVSSSARWLVVLGEGDLQLSQCSSAASRGLGDAGFRAGYGPRDGVHQPARKSDMCRWTTDLFILVGRIDVHVAPLPSAKEYRNSDAMSTL